MPIELFAIIVLLGIVLLGGALDSIIIHSQRAQLDAARQALEAEIQENLELLEENRRLRWHLNH